jgi:hypothetical protein
MTSWVHLVTNCYKKIIRPSTLSDKPDRRADLHINKSRVTYSTIITCMNRMPRLGEELPGRRCSHTCLVEKIVVLRGSQPPAITRYRDGPPFQFFDHLRQVFYAGSHGRHPNHAHHFPRLTGCLGRASGKGSHIHVEAAVA